MIELKVRIKNIKEIEKQIKESGAKFLCFYNETDTYFNIKNDKTLKIKEINSSSFLLFFERRKDNGFNFLRTEINNLDKMKNILRKSLGIKYVIKKKRKVYKYKNNLISINLIRGLGQFLILECKNGIKEAEEILRVFGFSEKDIVNESFDKLMQKVKK